MFFYGSCFDKMSRVLCRVGINKPLNQLVIKGNFGHLLKAIPHERSQQSPILYL